MKIISEFKEFALKGNVIDLAVGVIIGAAFGGVVTSLVQDVMMPPLGYLIGGLDFKDQAWTIQAANTEHFISGKKLAAPVVLSYGKFINAVIAFTIQAIAIFIVIKVINKAKRKPQPVPDQPTPLTKEQELLTEIRDALRR